MKKQIIVAMGREHGSGGHYIADMVARELHIKLYDKAPIEKEIASDGYSEKLVREMGEKRSTFLPPAESERSSAVWSPTASPPLCGAAWEATSMPPADSSGAKQCLRKGRLPDDENLEYDGCGPGPQG